MKARLSISIATLLVLLAFPTLAFAEDARSSMQLTLTVIRSDAEAAFLLDGIQAPVVLAALGVSLILTSTVLKSMYLRHRG